MDAEQESLANPFRMDEDCRHCSALCETRSQVVHGYGDAGADLAVVGTAPDGTADTVGVPFADPEGSLVYDLLAEVGRCEDPAATRPTVENAYLTYLTRCHHPDRGPTDEEVRACEAFLSSELRMVNPDLIVAVGQRTLEGLAFEYTTRSAEEFDVAAEHATTVRGRGFEILPMVPPREQTTEQTEAFRAHLHEELDRDYRQTKGRRGR